MAANRLLNQVIEKAGNRGNQREVQNDHV